VGLDHRWPRLKVAKIAEQNNPADGPAERAARSTAADAGYAAGLARAETEAVALRERYEQGLAKLAATIAEVDTKLCTAIMDCVVRTASAVVACELLSNEATARRLVQSAIDELRAQASDCLIEVAAADLEWFGGILPELRVVAGEGLHSPEFRIHFQLETREYCPAELVRASLVAVGQAEAAQT